MKIQITASCIIESDEYKTEGSIEEFVNGLNDNGGEAAFQQLTTCGESGTCQFICTAKPL